MEIISTQIFEKLLRFYFRICNFGSTLWVEKNCWQATCTYYASNILYCYFRGIFIICDIAIIPLCIIKRKISRIGKNSRQKKECLLFSYLFNLGIFFSIVRIFYYFLKYRNLENFSWWKFYPTLNEWKISY